MPLENNYDRFSSTQAGEFDVSSPYNPEISVPKSKKKKKKPKGPKTDGTLRTATNGQPDSSSIFQIGVKTARSAINWFKGAYGKTSGGGGGIN